MRTKLILGLTVSVLTAAQIASAQGVSTSLTADSQVGNAAGNYVQIISTATDTTPTVVPAAADGTANDDSSAFSSSKSDGSTPDASMSAASWNFGETEQQDVTSTDSQNLPSFAASASFQSKRDSYTSSDWAADGNWLSTIPAAQSGLAPAPYQDASMAASAEANFATKSMMDASVGATAGRAGPPGGAVAVPQLLAPEPGTVGLMIFGGAALVGVLRRRK